MPAYYLEAAVVVLGIVTTYPNAFLLSFLMRLAIQARLETYILLIRDIVVVATVVEVITELGAVVCCVEMVSIGDCAVASSKGTFATVFFVRGMSVVNWVSRDSAATDVVVVDCIVVVFVVKGVVGVGCVVVASVVRDVVVVCCVVVASVVRGVVVVCCVVVASVVRGVVVVGCVVVATVVRGVVVVGCVVVVSVFESVVTEGFIVILLVVESVVGFAPVVLETAFSLAVD